MTHLTSLNIAQEIERVIADPTTSFWLRNNIQLALNRDPVDALQDAKHLTDILRAHLDKLFEQAMHQNHVNTSNEVRAVVPMQDDAYQQEA